MEIKFYEECSGPLSPEDVANREAVDQNEQFALVKLLQGELQATDEPLILSLDLGTPSRLHAEIHRHGKSMAVLWIAKPDDDHSDLVAFSAFLTGVNPPDDFAAIESLKKHGPSMDAKGYNKILSLSRPTIAAMYLDAEWLKNSKINMAAMALAVAHFGGPSANPTIIEPNRAPTPEEEAEMQRRITKVGRVFRIIQHDWQRRGKLLYNVRAQEKISGRPIADIMNVKFWVGVDGQGGDVLDIHELAAVFDLLKDYQEQIPGVKYHKTPTTTTLLNFRRLPHELASYIQTIRIGEPK